MLPLLVTLVIPAAALSQTSERIDVVAVEIVLDVRDRQGNVPRVVAPDDLTVLEDGKPVTVLSVERIVDATGPASPATASTSTEANVAAWHTVLYFDQTLSTQQTIRMTASGLSRHAEELTQLGYVEVVVSDGAPRRLLPPTRDAHRVREALDRVRRDYAGYDRLRRHRAAFLAAGYRRDLAARGALLQEQAMIRETNLALSGFLGARTSARAGAVILVSDGWDLDPLDFYAQYSREIDEDVHSNPSDEIVSGSEEIDTWSAIASSMRGDDTNRRLMLESSASGWTIFPLGGGVVWSSDRDASSGGGFRPLVNGRSSMELIAHATDPLLELAESTGGQYARHPRSLDEQIGAMRERFVLTYQSSRTVDARLRRVEVRSVDPRWKVQARQWVSDAPTESLSLTRIRSLALAEIQKGDLPVRLEVRVGENNTHELLTTIELEEILPILRQREQTRLRLTVRAVDAEGREAIVHQEIALEDPGSEATLLHVAPLRLRDSTTSVSVVVEEYVTGSWGGAAVETIPVITPREEFVMMEAQPGERVC